MLANVLHAHFADVSELRAADRRVLCLDAHAATPSGGGGIQIHNLSRTGMLAGSATDVPVGTAIEVEMPGGMRHRAEVVWQDAELFGCRFDKPLSQATLSAALLRAAPVVPPTADAAVLVDNDAIARLRQHWDFEHEIAAVVDTRMPLRSRAWTIITLGLVSWAIPTALVARLLA